VSAYTPGPWVVSEGELRSDGNPIVGGPEDLERAAACVNACEGINPEAIPDLVAALERIERLTLRNVQPEDDGLAGWEPVATNRITHIRIVAKAALRSALVKQ
jgi:hypothetical protein